MRRGFLMLKICPVVKVFCIPHYDTSEKMTVVTLWQSNWLSRITEEIWVYRIGFKILSAHQHK